MSLPSGSWVDIGLAMAIAGAVALVWAHRQRRYIPWPPTATTRTTDPDLAPMPPVIGQIRRGLRRLSAGHANAPTSDAPHTITEAGVDMRTDDLAAGSGAATENEGNGTHPDTRPGADEPNQADALRETTASVDVPVVPSLANPLSALWPPAGLGLTGPGAHAAARGCLTAALAAGGLHDPDARTEVVMPSPTAATLLGAPAVNLPRTPRLTITTGLDEALQILEAQTMHRTRLLDRHEVNTVAELRHTDPYEEPQPPIMLLADASIRHERARVAALLAQGQHLDIHGVLLGPWSDGNTVMVADDGVTTPADEESQRPGSHPADVGRLAILTPAETADLLATLAESHTGQPQPPPPTEPAPPPLQAATPTSTAAATTPTDTPVVAPTDTDADAEQDVEAGCDRSGDTYKTQSQAGAIGITDVSVPVELRAAASQGGDARPTADATATVNHRRTAVGGWPPAAGHRGVDAEPTTQPGRVAVRVLGIPGIADGDPQRSLRAKSLELLVYLAVRHGSASTEAILDDLLPDAPASKAVHRLHTYVSDLRGVLRHNGGPGTYLTHPHRRYELNPESFDIDLWRMRAAVRAADAAGSQPERVAELRRAVDTYQPLAEGREYEWLEPYRETVRQDALDAAVALAEELAGQPTEQLAALDAAISQHSYAEQLYQAAMRARAQLGHLDAIRALRRTLTRRLAEIDAEPADDTLALADQLTADLRRAGRTDTTRPHRRSVRMNTAPHTGNPTTTAGAATSPDTGLHLRRLRWAVRATLTLGVAASVAANVLHAESNPISQIIAAWPPLALLLTVELISRVPHHRRSLGAIRIIATAIIAAIATWVSYWHLVGVATRYGETEAAAAYLLPISVDGLVIVASVSLVELTARIRTATPDQQPALIASPESPPAATESATHVLRQRSARPSTLAPEQRPAARAEAAPAGTRTRRPVRAVTVPTAPQEAAGAPTAAPDGARQDAGNTANVDSAAGSDHLPQAAAASDPATPADTANGKALRSARPHQRSANPQPLDRLDDAQRVDPPPRRPDKEPRTETDTAEGAVSDGGPVPSETDSAVAYWYRREPNLHPAEIAARIGRSERTVRRYWPPPATRHPSPATTSAT